MPKDITEGIGGSQGPFVGLPRRLLHSCSAPTGSCLDNSPLPPNTFALDYHRRVLVFFFFLKQGTGSHYVTLPGLELATQTYIGAFERTEIYLSLLLECQD